MELCGSPAAFFEAILWSWSCTFTMFTVISSSFICSRSVINWAVVGSPWKLVDIATQWLLPQFYTCAMSSIVGSSFSIMVVGCSLSTLGNLFCSLPTSISDGFFVTCLELSPNVHPCLWHTVLNAQSIRVHYRTHLANAIPSQYSLMLKCMCLMRGGAQNFSLYGRENFMLLPT